MSRSEHECFAKRVVHYYEKVSLFDKENTVRHFTAEGKHKNSIYRIIRRYEQSGEVNFKKIPGRPRVQTSPKKVRRVKAAFTKDPTTSVRVAARKLNLDKSAVSRIKVHDLGIKAQTQKKAPKYIKNQEQRAKTGLRKVYKKTREKVLVIDDETYVTFDPSQLPGRKFFHAQNINEVKYEDRFKKITKFPKKYLIWQAMDEEGHISQTYISDGTMNADVYLNECLKKRLIPFIKQHHEIDEVLFWPDLATSHYANTVKNFLVEEKVDFVQKKDNPPNVPQARGIELFWALCKQRYSTRKVEPKNLHGFKLIWQKISKQVAGEVGIDVMRHAAKMIREIGYKGVRQAMCNISNKANP